MSVRRAGIAALVAACAVCSNLAGCGALTIHDAGRAKLANDSSQAYLDAKVTEAPEIEANNLAFLLSEEIKAVRDNVSLQVDIAALGIANNSGPMFDSVLAAQQRLRLLGFVGGSADVRKFFDARILAQSKLATAETEANLLKAKGMTPPDCETVAAAAPDALPQPSEDVRELFERYARRCREALPLPPPSSGSVAQAGSDWAQARLRLSELKAEAATAQVQVTAAVQAYQVAAGQGKSTADLSKELTDREAKLLEALQTAQKLKLGGAFESTVDALVQTLTAAATDQANPTDPAQARAAIVLKALPSLAADAQAFQEARSALPVSGLLLELQRQTVLATAAAKQEQLMQQRVDILKARFDSYLDEARAWLRFTDAACSNAVLVAGNKHPGNNCGNFVMTPPACSVPGTPIQQCSLAQSWKVRFSTDKAEAKRELYKAATGYLQAIAAQGPQLEQQYREIDVRHREALLAKTTALAGWDNLVSVPINQLDAYYKGGVQPTEIADLIVKALGVIAIAVGVTK